MSDDDIESMVQDAEAHAEEDQKRREEAETKNHADALIHATEKSLSDLGDQVPDEEKTAIEGTISELKTDLEGDDLEDIKAKSEALMQASMKLCEMAYQSQHEAEGDGDGPAAAQADGPDDVVDADFEEVDDDDKKSASA